MSKGPNKRENDQVSTNVQRQTAKQKTTTNKPNQKRRKQKTKAKTLPPAVKINLVRARLPEFQCNSRLIISQLCN